MKPSEILFWLSIIIVFIPMLSQWFIGRELIKKNKSSALNWLYGVTIFFQFVVTALSFLIQGKSFAVRAMENDWGEPPYNIPPPVVGLPISFVLGIVLLIIGYRQIREVTNKQTKKKTEKSFG